MSSKPHVTFFGVIRTLIVAVLNLAAMVIAWALKLTGYVLVKTSEFIFKIIG